MNLVLALDSIRSTHNVGSVFRTSDAAGVSHIVLGGITPSPIDRFGRERSDIAKVALGAQSTVSYSCEPDLLLYLVTQKNNGAYIAALEQSPTSVSLFDWTLDLVTHPKTDTIILVVGNEVTGVDKNILDIANVVIELPQVGAKESLNVSVASGIALYHISKKVGIL